MRLLALLLCLLAAPATALTIAIDPGHGGEDPGAIKGGVTEAALTYDVSLVLASVLLERGYTVTITRAKDETLGLVDRLAAARNAGADLLISIHADSLLVGTAAGLSVYVHAEDSSTPETEALVRQEIATELLFGPPAAQPESDVAGALMELAQRATKTNSDLFAEMLVARFAQDGLPLYKRPVQSGDFVVLRSPAIPAVLIELGFLDSAQDRERLQQAAWRLQFAGSVADAITEWSRRVGLEE